MDMVQVISQLGFPIAACCAMGWYVKYITDKNAKQLDEIRKSHEAAENTIKEAIINNTIVMTKLCERLGEHNEND